MIEQMFKDAYRDKQKEKIAEKLKSDIEDEQKTREEFGILIGESVDFSEVEIKGHIVNISDRFYLRRDLKLNHWDIDIYLTVWHVFCKVCDKQEMGCFDAACIGHFMLYHECKKSVKFWKRFRKGD